MIRNIFLDTITYWYDFPSNYSNGQNVSSLGTFLQYTNYAADYYLGALILVAVFTISFLILKTQSFEKAFAPACFITLGLSILFMRISLIGLPIVIMLAVITILAIILVRTENHRGF